MSRVKKVKLQSSDKELFKVDESVAYESQFLKHTIENNGTDSVFTLPTVCSEILAKVIDYCSYHVESQKSFDDKPAVSEDEIKKWDAKFVKVDKDTLLGLVRAADYLNIGSLLKLTTQAVADMIVNKSADEVRKTFNIKNQFPAEEEERNRPEN